jgi:hypothetical protein
LDILAPIAMRWGRARLASITISAGSKQLLAAGIVVLLADETILIKLEDGGEELSLEIIIQQTAPPPAEIKPPQLSFTKINDTSAKLNFLDIAGPFKTGYHFGIGTINKKKLTVNFLVVNLVQMNELTYSFWAEAETDG